MEVMKEQQGSQTENCEGPGSGIPESSHGPDSRQGWARKHWLDPRPWQPACKSPARRAAGSNEGWGLFVLPSRKASLSGMCTHSARNVNLQPDSPHSPQETTKSGGAKTVPPSATRSPSPGTPERSSAPGVPARSRPGAPSGGQGARPAQVARATSHRERAQLFAWIPCNLQLPARGTPDPARNFTQKAERRGRTMTPGRPGQPTRRLRPRAEWGLSSGGPGGWRAPPPGARPGAGWRGRRGTPREVTRPAPASPRPRSPALRRGRRALDRKSVV